jgi:hypothetical protein
LYGDRERKRLKESRKEGRGNERDGKERREGGRNDLQLLFKTSLSQQQENIKYIMLCDSVQCVVFTASQIFKTAENRLRKCVCK